jgi:hypothetical protein
VLAGAVGQPAHHEHHHQRASERDAEGNDRSRLDTQGQQQREDNGHGKQAVDHR